MYAARACSCAVEVWQWGLCPYLCWSSYDLSKKSLSAARCASCAALSRGNRGWVRLGRTGRTPILCKAAPSTAAGLPLPSLGVRKAGCACVYAAVACGSGSGGGPAPPPFAALFPLCCCCFGWLFAGGRAPGALRTIRPTESPKGRAVHLSTRRIQMTK